MFGHLPMPNPETGDVGEFSGRMMMLVWAIFLLVVGFILVLITRHTGRLIGFGLTLLSMFILALYIIMRGHPTT